MYFAYLKTFTYHTEVDKKLFLIYQLVKLYKWHLYRRHDNHIDASNSIFLFRLVSESITQSVTDMVGFGSIQGYKEL